jgi:hypothetical protein
MFDYDPYTKDDLRNLLRRILKSGIEGMEEEIEKAIHMVNPYPREEQEEE